MAFHVACPITCRKICFCAFGFTGELRSEKGKNDFLQEVARVEQFLNDPWLIKARENATIQVKVPKVVISPAPAPPGPQFPAAVSVGAGVGGDEAAKMAASSQVKRAVLQKQAAAASMVAEDYARKFESGDLVDVGEEQDNPNSKVMCRLCFSGENEGSDRSRKMLSCNSCGKKYHRSCLKAWSQNRDLFHWSSWACPSCRTCEVCRRTGDPSKFMFCKRCDGACHCYCQQPPHKNVGHGPYLCPKHTKCHSCSSSVPGNGLSVRWFLGYTCCDACGRLFVKGNYCPVCLKVYRDSESTPMVCCDICQRWVHCPCDGISDAKYMQFQVDGNLQYVCPMCRGECCQIRTIEEAVPELWRRRDEVDKDLIASLRAAAGLPTQDEIFDISPFSDDEESGPLLKSEQGRSVKFPVKGLGDKSPKKSKDHGKKSSKKSKKKGNGTTLICAADAYQGAGGQVDGPVGYDAVSNKKEEMQSPGAGDNYSPITGSVTEGVSAANDAAVSKHKSVDELKPTNVTKASRTIRIKSSNKSYGLANIEETGTNSGAPKAAQGPKLVIHLGGRCRNASTPPRSEALSNKRAQDLTSPSEIKIDQVKGSKPRENEGHLMKLKNANSEHSNPSSNFFGEFADGYESVSPKNKYSVLGKRGIEEITYARRGSQAPTGRQKSGTGDLIDGSSSMPSISQASSKDHRPYLKFKIHRNSNTGNQNVSSNLNIGNQNPSPLPVKEEITYTRGQRSKRKRPVALGDEDMSLLHEENTVKDLSDANWILQKLGKDAAGKRVEIHQPSSDSWYRGTVTEISEDASMVSIALDDGRNKSFELGKHGIRFVSQKPKH